MLDPIIMPGPALASVRSMTDVATLRTRIDSLDAEIVALVARRREVSREIQGHRAAAGDGPLAAVREQEIVDTYAAALGEDGRELAAAVLVLCRGRH